MKLLPRGTCPTRWGRAAPALAVALWGTILASAGCASSSAPNAAQVRAAYEHANSRCRLGRESHFTLGGIKLGAVKYVLRLSDDEDVAETLSHLRWVEVATYRMVTPRECAEVSDLGGLGREMVNLGWWPLVVERDRSDESWVFSHSDAEGDLDGLFVINMDGGELEVVRLDGRIDRLLADGLSVDLDEVSAISDLAR